MTSERKVVCLDACIFIDWLKNEPGRADLIAALFEDAEAEKVQLITSTMAILETVYVPDKTPEEARQAIDDLFAQPWLTVVQFNLPGKALLSLRATAL